MAAVQELESLFEVTRATIVSAEAHLIEEACAGNPDSFGVLYEQYIDKLHKHLYFRTGNKSDAEDLTAQTFLKAWDAMPRYRQMGRPFGTWLMSIAHNLLIDHYRKRRESVNLDDVVIPAGEEVDPEVLADRHIENEALRKALFKLTSENHRAAVVMRYIDGMKPGEIAEVMGTTAGNVRVMVFRGLLELRGIMA